ncbi:lysophospholipid acyltransferase family protein [Clostridium sp. A1-XYC3]|uniref:1-acyl-sn-glycerol-3-phosphate acyltransferase n=1 Tax=Clostridium tanneri TaxID=3037988 RepID=A0ABU4JVB2_9CLOT|nr:lysophospholipid acyltransferase family protein [Clostridium sp. A1-XYC3]MDW8802100.1 lysophospholipid acyltransferase family protein [Clostridium sp. A1-XYC3]
MKSFLFYLNFFTYIIKLNMKKNEFEKLKKQGNKSEIISYLNNVVLGWASHVLSYVKADIKVVGRENIPEETCLYVANHQGFFDIPIMIHSLDKTVGFIAKKELLKFRVLTYWMEQMHCIFMDRSNMRESIKSINEGVENLKNGHNLVIFPEGTRSKGPSIGEFKKGSLKLALKSGVPIVPVAIDGSYKLREGNEKSAIKSAEVKVTICKPIYMDELSKEEKTDLAEKVKEIIASNITIE